MTSVLFTVVPFVCAIIYWMVVLFKEGVCLSVQHTFPLLEMTLQFPPGPPLP